MPPVSPVGGSDGGDILESRPTSSEAAGYDLHVTSALWTDVISRIDALARRADAA